jgi:hypothetical protein
MAIAIPDAFGGRAGLFAGGYLALQWVRNPFVAETLVTIAPERDAPAIVVGAHGHGTLGEVILDSTSRDVIRRAEQPVVIAREPRR